MPILKRIKEDLEFSQELADLLDVLRGIASFQFRKTKESRQHFKTFLDCFESFFRIIDLTKAEHPLVSIGSDRMGIVMITSNEGFMGGLNAQVINTALEEKKDNPAELIVVGERGASYIKGLGEKFTFFQGINNENKYQILIELRDYIIQQKLKGKIGKVVLSYPEPVSFTQQRVKLINLLPYPELFKGREPTISETEKVIIESSLDGIVKYLVTTWITHKLYEIFEDSRLSEFAARTINLERSHQKLSQRNKLLRYQYFDTLHKLIDRNMRDIFTSSLLRKQKRESR